MDRDETLKSSYEKLQRELQQLFMEWWMRIRSGNCPRLGQTQKGTYHKMKDKEKISALLEKGWDTPVSVLENYGKLLAQKS